MTNMTSDSEVVATTMEIRRTRDFKFSATWWLGGNEVTPGGKLGKCSRYLYQLFCGGGEQRRTDGARALFLGGITRIREGEERGVALADLRRDEDGSSGGGVSAVIEEHGTGLVAEEGRRPRGRRESSKGRG